MPLLIKGFYRDMGEQGFFVNKFASYILVYDQFTLNISHWELLIKLRVSYFYQEQYQLIAADHELSSLMFTGQDWDRFFPATMSEYKTADYYTGALKEEEVLLYL